MRYSALTVLMKNGDLTLNNVTIMRGQGGIQNTGGDLTITNSTFTGNSAGGSGGGAILSLLDDLTITGSVFNGNSAGVGGGAIGSEDSNIDITNSCIENNTTTHTGFTDVHLEIGPVTAEDNWWGAATGPNTPGADTTNVNVTSWLNAPDAVCPPLPDDGESTAPQLPPPPMANEWPGAELAAYDLPDGFYARVLMRNGAWLTHAGTVPGNLIDNYVILAIDLFHLSGEREFGVHVPVCLLGEGRLIFLDAMTSPRVQVELATFSADEYTCGYVPNVGTLVLISGN